MNENLTLQKRRLQGRTIDGREDEGLDLSTISAFQAVITTSAFTRCDFSMGDLQQTSLAEVSFYECDMRFVNFRGSKLRSVRFDKCDLRNSAFVGIHPMDGVIFEDCQLQYSSFYDSTVRAAAWKKSNLHGADVRFMEIDNDKVTFEDCNLWNVSLRMGCTFFNAHYDARSADLFVGLAAWVHPSEEDTEKLKGIAGPEYNTVAKLMQKREG